MAIIRTGHLIGRISGVLGSEDFVNGRGSSYVRRRPRKTNQHTAPQEDRRKRFAAVVQNWQIFGEPNRAAWRAAAKLVTFPNRVGVQRSISGFQFYVSYAMARRTDTLMWDFGPPNLVRAASPEDIILTASASGSIEINFTIKAPSGISEIYVQAARPVSSSPRTHFSNYKFLAGNTFLVGSRTFTITTEFDQIFGHPAEGEHISVRLHTWKDFTMFSAWVNVSAEVTA